MVDALKSLATQTVDADRLVFIIQDTSISTTAAAIIKGMTTTVVVSRSTLLSALRVANVGFDTSKVGHRPFNLHVRPQHGSLETSNFRLETFNLRVRLTFQTFKLRVCLAIQTVKLRVRLSIQTYKLCNVLVDLADFITNVGLKHANPCVDVGAKGVDAASEGVL